MKVSDLKKYDMFISKGIVFEALSVDKARSGNLIVNCQTAKGSRYAMTFRPDHELKITNK